ncbi:coiled-coil domain-containing protein [Flavobacterium humi]|uniref:Chromosome partitioning protein ParA n=1 Tax=Flavobacterium humi TaxID=2562683 RepID=A0A4Z0LD90_9FLAO|nr:hypothetical protein [Flavobacterium humi]TGD59834.1 hypothetical protein E4635_02575 [Flavobacterium humi]
MEENQKQSNSGLKAIILILALLLLGSLGYMYKLTSDSKAVEKVLMSEKDSVLKDLHAANDSLSAAIASNTSMSEELIVERDRVQKLMADVEKSKGDAASMSKYKTEAIKLRSSVDNLMKQVTQLKKQNERLTVERDSTAVVLTDARRANDTLTAHNDNLAKTVEKGSRLTILNLQTSAVKQRSSGKQVATDKASRADVLKISFMIAENLIAKSGDKAYYVQVIDSKNNVLGEKKTEAFGEKSLTYSFIATVKYENKTVKVEKDLSVADIQGGSYFVNIFDKDVLVSKTSFTLR